MKTKELQALFEKHEDEFAEFDRIQNAQSSRPDIHAFLLLNQLVPGKTKIVSCAEHDEIWLAVSPDELAKSIVVDSHGESIIIDLIRCGVRYDSLNDSLAMFV